MCSTVGHPQTKMKNEFVDRANLDFANVDPGNLKILEFPDDLQKCMQRLGRNYLLMKTSFWQNKQNYKWV